MNCHRAEIHNHLLSEQEDCLYCDIERQGNEIAELRRLQAIYHDFIERVAKVEIDNIPIADGIITNEELAATQELEDIIYSAREMRGDYV